MSRRSCSDREIRNEQVGATGPRARRKGDAQMPFVWCKPEQFLSYQGVRIFHAYKDDLSDVPLDFWYSTSDSACADSPYEFDVRELPGCQSPARDPDQTEHAAVIKQAIDSGLLRPDTPVQR